MSPVFQKSSNMTRSTKYLLSSLYFSSILVQKTRHPLYVQYWDKKFTSEKKKSKI